MNTQTAKTRSKIVSLTLGLVLFVATLASGMAVLSAPAYAEDNKCTGKPNFQDKDLKPCIGDKVPSGTDPASQGKAKSSQDLVNRYVNPFIKLLSALVGVIVTISIIYGGIQYASSAGDPSKVAAAKKRILNTILGLLAFLFMLAFLNWLVPGGVLQ